MITLQITTITAKKHYTSSGESIENLLYYKDCNHKALQASTVAPLRLPLKEREPDCPCPRMCCSMCCDCNAPQSFFGRQQLPMQSSMIEPMRSPMMPSQSMQPASSQIPKGRKKITPKLRDDSPMLQPPIGGRRDFTRENIKSLISQDEDIKKVLKDLVRVTMKKADLVDMVQNNKDWHQSDKNSELPDYSYGEEE